VKQALLVSRAEAILIMKTIIACVSTAVAVLAIGGVARAQERPVPGDSARISIPGCAKGRVFVVTATPEHEPSQADIAPGRRFRLSGPKDVLNDIKKREGRMIEVTGLVRKAALTGPGGIAIAGGRVRIGGGSPQASTGDPTRSLEGYNQAVLDVEGWRVLEENCGK
jgi:hypothetical protein